MTAPIWHPLGPAADNLALSIGPLIGVITVPDTLLEITLSDSSGYIYTYFAGYPYPQVRQTPVWDSAQSSLTILGRYNTQLNLDAAFTAVVAAYAIDAEALPDDNQITIQVNGTTWVAHRPRIGMFGLIPESINDQTLVALQYQYLFDYIEGGPSDPARQSVVYNA